MGFLSWVRRLRESTAAHDVRDPAAPGPRGDRPLAGLLGQPDRTAPVQHPSVPTALTAERIATWFGDHGHAWFVDSDGDLGGLWRGRLFWFFLFGERQEILQVRAQWNRELAIERLPDVLELCNAWNADRIWPKAYARVRDDGMVAVTCEVATDLEQGVTDDQLGQLLMCGISSATAFFDTVDDAYPDPAAEAP